MNKRYRNTIVDLIALAVFVGFGVSSNKSARIIRNNSVNSVRASRLSSPDVRRYQIDAGESHFMVHAFVGGLLSGFGHNHNIAIQGISGEAQFTDGTVCTGFTTHENTS